MLRIPFCLHRCFIPLHCCRVPLLLLQLTMECPDEYIFNASTEIDRRTPTAKRYRCRAHRDEFEGTAVPAAHCSSPLPLTARCLFFCTAVSAVVIVGMLCPPQQLRGYFYVRVEMSIQALLFFYTKYTTSVTLSF